MQAIADGSRYFIATFSNSPVSFYIQEGDTFGLKAILGSASKIIVAHGTSLVNLYTSSGAVESWVLLNATDFTTIHTGTRSYELSEILTIADGATIAPTLSDSAYADLISQTVTSADDETKYIPVIEGITEEDVITETRTKVEVNTSTGTGTGTGSTTTDLSGILEWLEAIWTAITAVATATWTPIVNAIDAFGLKHGGMPQRLLLSIICLYCVLTFSAFGIGSIHCLAIWQHGGKHSLLQFPT